MKVPIRKSPPVSRAENVLQAAYVRLRLMRSSSTSSEVKPPPRIVFATCAGSQSGSARRIERLPRRICVCVASGLSTRRMRRTVQRGGAGARAARASGRACQVPNASPSRSTASAAVTSPTSATIVSFGRYQRS